MQSRMMGALLSGPVSTRWVCMHPSPGHLWAPHTPGASLPPLYPPRPRRAYPGCTRGEPTGRAAASHKTHDDDGCDKEVDRLLSPVGIEDERHEADLDKRQQGQHHVDRVDLQGVEQEVCVRLAATSPPFDEMALCVLRRRARASCWDGQAGRQVPLHLPGAPSWRAALRTSAAQPSCRSSRIKGFLRLRSKGKAAGQACRGVRASPAEDR